MIKYDFKKFVKISGENDYQEKIHLIRKVLDKKQNGEIFLNTKKCINSNDLKRIKSLSDYINKNAETFIVIGTGGSIASKGIVELLGKNNIEVLYTGYSLNSANFNNLLEYIKNKNIVVNVVSKSGNTLETTLIFSKILELMKEKYTKKELEQRIIITTYNAKGKLFNIAKRNNFKIFRMPNISGRYSILTTAGLLPMCVAGINIDDIILGFNNSKITDKCFIYAVLRDILYKSGKKIEAFTIYDERLIIFINWVKQLFAETQGKNKKGILPITVFNTRDMHSLGQYLNDGEDIIFSTVINIVNNKDVIINNKSLNKINNIAVINIASSLSSSSFMINIDRLNEKNIGELIYFFMTSAAIGGYLMGVNPYNQNGVKKYKELLKESIKCMK